ncbi:MAG: VOC family protein [Rhodospirillaceae bacterium]|nr:VOC family protein [Rhodospirillaceae bacterium]
MPHDQPHHHHHDHDHHDHHDHDHGPALKIQTVRVYAGDFAGAYAFYAQALGLKPVAGSAEGPYALFDTGAAQLAVERIPPGHPAYAELVGRFAGVSFRVDDLSATYRHLTDHGVEFMAPPQRQSWGGGIAHFRDPAGNILSLVGRLDPEAA